MRIFRRVDQMQDFEALDDDVTLRKEGGVLVGSTGGGGGASDAEDVAFAPAGNVAATDVQAAIEELDAEKATPAQITSAISALSTVYQPLDTDLTAIAALSTTSFGRGLLTLANQAALLAAAGAAAASHVHAGEDITSGIVADAQIASTIARDSEVTSAISALSTVYQPLDSDLTSIAALTTTSFGRGLLALADAAALRSTAGLVIGTDVEAHDTDLTTIAGLTPSNDDVLQRKGGAWANRTIAQLLTDLGAAGTTFQPLDSDLTAIAALTTNAAGRGLLTLADPNADVVVFWDDSAGAYTHLTMGTNLTITGTTLDAAGGSTNVEDANLIVAMEVFA